MDNQYPYSEEPHPNRPKDPWDPPPGSVEEPSEKSNEEKDNESRFFLWAFLDAITMGCRGCSICFIILIGLLVWILAAVF